MIVCHLNKPESTLDAVRKAHAKLKPTDAALIASSLVLCGRYAIAVYDEQEYHWPDDSRKLTDALRIQLSQIQDTLETPVKKTKAAMAAAEEETVEVKIGLKANYSMGETILGDREDLKTLLSDILAKGVEFQFGPTDIIGWQWAMDRANWSTLSDGELTRRMKIKAVFQDSSVGVELGASGAKKKTSRAKAVVEAPVEPEVVAEVVEVEGEPEPESGS